MSTKQDSVAFLGTFPVKIATETVRASVGAFMAALQVGITPITTCVSCPPQFFVSARALDFRRVAMSTDKRHIDKCETRFAVDVATLFRALMSTLKSLVARKKTVGPLRFSIASQFNRMPALRDLLVHNPRAAVAIAVV